MSLDNLAVAHVAAKTTIHLNKVLSTLNLLVTEDCTVPFISRYRKEATGGLDEVQIRDIKNFYEEYLETEKRRSYILEAIKKQEMLTPALEKKIKSCETLNQLEDIYAPYKSKKKTKAMIAKEAGLEPLAQKLLTGAKSYLEMVAEIESEFVKDKITDVAKAINGASDIIVEEFAHSIEVKEKIRAEYWRSAKIRSSLRKDGDKIKDFDKFKDFFEFEELISKIKDPKNTHRFMAMRRGMNLKVLKIEVILEGEYGVKVIEANHFPTGNALGNFDLLLKLAEKAYQNYISTSLDLEVKTDLKKVADEAAISVFGVNLKSLLLQPYLGSKAVLAIDPGIRTGCKVIVIDKTGKFIGDHVIYPFEPRKDVSGSKLVIDKMIEAFDIKYIAIGNGTNGRETLEFLEDNIKAVKDDKVKATLISEAGASIYSASDIARSEFPDKDVTVRGAISIGRRFQDPLAELVKIDPKSIGVGQYQHDVNQIKLKKSLEAVVEGCVNFVGVDLNTASAPLISYISGIGPSVAANIVKYREKKGAFKKREELLEVSRFSQKVFEQSAGFLRIYNGENPLDSTFIHPERYAPLRAWAKKNSLSPTDLLKKEVIDKLKRDSELRAEIGEMSFDDIIKSLSAPKQDPRSEFKSIEFRKDIRKISDLKLGEWYTGVVNNITNFGAFVDLGVKESGLLHISQIADEFIENPLDKLTVGQELKVRVTEVDIERRRIGLSCKSDGDVNYSKQPSGGSRQSSKANKKAKAPQEIRNNPFAGLANLKLK